MKAYVGLCTPVGLSEDRERNIKLGWWEGNLRLSSKMVDESCVASGKV